MPTANRNQLTGGICYPGPFACPFPGSRQPQSCKALQPEFSHPWLGLLYPPHKSCAWATGVAPGSHQKITFRSSPKKKYIHCFRNLKKNINFLLEETVLLLYILIYLSLCQHSIKYDFKYFLSGTGLAKTHWPTNSSWEQLARGLGRGWEAL